MRSVHTYGSGSRLLCSIPPLLLFFMLVGCSPPHDPGHLEPQAEGLELQGSVDNWALGNDYYVFLGSPDVTAAGNATFPESYAAAPIARDGSFTLHLSEPPASVEPGGICGDSSSELSRSFHYLAVTREPEPGEQFTDIAYLRPDSPGEGILFVTWLSGRDQCVKGSLDRGWHTFLRTDEGEDGTVHRLEPEGEISYTVSL